MPPDTRLIVCPNCACHAKPSEMHCPTCGTLLRSHDNWVVPAAAIIAMGLTAVTCGDDGTGGGSGDGGMDGGMGGMTTSQSVNSVGAAYVVASTADVGPGPGGGMGIGGAGGEAGAGGSQNTGGSGGAAGAGGSGGAAGAGLK